MSKYDWNITMPESILKTQEILNGLAAPALAISEVWKNAIPQYDFSGIQAAMSAHLENMKIISTQINQMSSVAKSVLPLIDTSVYASLVDTQAIKSTLASIDWSWVKDAYAETFDIENDGEQNDSENITSNEVTPEIRAEIAADISEVLANPDEMQQISQSKYLQWKAKNPGLAAFFIEVLLPILAILVGLAQLGVAIWQARPVKNSQVYEEPTSASNVVCNVTVQNNITVIGDAPYFYKVEIPNPETGELLTGYIYKGNLTTADTAEMDVHEIPENTELAETTPEATESQTEPAE